MDKPFIIITNNTNAIAFATEAEALAHLEALAKENPAVIYGLYERLATAHTPRPTDLPPPVINRRK